MMSRVKKSWLLATSVVHSTISTMTSCFGTIFIFSENRVGILVACARQALGFVPREGLLLALVSQESLFCSWPEKVIHATVGTNVLSSIRGLVWIEVR